MDLPRELIDIIQDKYAYELISRVSQGTFIQNLKPKDLQMLRMYDLYHLAKYRVYTNMDGEKCSISLNWAIRYGCLDICEWIIEKTEYKFDTGFLNHPQVLAAAGGHIDIMEWLVNKRILPIPESFDTAASNGHLHVLEWLKANGYTGASLRTLWYAKNLDKDDIVKWLEENYNLR